MATSLSAEALLMKEVMVYHQVAEYLKTYDQIATEETKRYVIASGFGQQKDEFKVVVYTVRELKPNKADDLSVYIKEKYNSIIGSTDQTVNFKWWREEVIPTLLNLYTFWKKGRTTNLNRK